MSQSDVNHLTFSSFQQAPTICFVYNYKTQGVIIGFLGT